MISEVGASVAEDISEASGVRGLNLVHNRPLEQLLFDRNLMGVDFRSACLEASRFFVAHIANEISAASELVILSKGLMYQLAEAARLECQLNLPMNLIATSRQAVTSQDAMVDVAYSRFDAGGETLLIGDTVASGATIVAALAKYCSEHELKRLYVFSYAGALVGAARVSEYCRDHDIELTMLFGLAAFGLGSNGFDLSFLHPQSMARQEYIARARRQFEGHPVSAVGWDFGAQSMSPEKYRELCWVEAKMWGLEGSQCLAEVSRPVSFANIRSESGAYDGIFSPDDY